MEDISSLDLDDAQQRKRRRRNGGGGVLFLLGLALGVAGTVLVPRYLGGYLPDSLSDLLRRDTQVEGPVLGKRQEDDRLLLTVQAEQGAVLATFRERMAEIDLLVDVGDTVTLGVSRYEPFVENPAFRGIRKATGSAIPRGAGDVSGAEGVPESVTSEVGAPAAEGTSADEGEGEGPAEPGSTPADSS